MSIGGPHEVLPSHGAEDAVDVCLDFGCVLAVTDRHTRSPVASIVIVPDRRR